MSTVRHLFTPGPVPVHPAVLRAASMPPLYHRHHTFAELMERVQARLQLLFETSSPVAVLTCSATGAHEAIAHMLHARGSEAIVCTNGRFSQRWAQMLERFGVRVHRVESAWGENIALDALEHALHHAPSAHSVWLVHSETSTGVLAPLERILPLVRSRAPEIIVCVDATSSIGIHPIRMDALGIDVVIASSQKGTGGLPGLGLVAVSDRGRAAFLSSPPSLYFDLHATLDALTNGTTPFTPAVSLVAALDASLVLIEQEGLPQRWERYEHQARAVRTCLEQAGYHVFGECSSNSVTVAYIPEGIPNFVEELEQRFGILVARGQEDFRNVLFRIGHCGWYTEEDYNALFHALATIVH